MEQVLGETVEQPDRPTVSARLDQRRRLVRKCVPRLSSGAPVVDYRADAGTQFLFGVLDPSWVAPSPGRYTPLSLAGRAHMSRRRQTRRPVHPFYAALAFVSGFSERFAHDVI
jgi:hypothetical protein